MKRTILSLALASMALCAPTNPAIAQDDEPIEIDTTIMKDKKEVPLNPDKAYILLQTPSAVPATFFRVPTEDERAFHKELYNAAYDKAYAKWEKRVAKYEAR
ncbi:MAG: hypothetical protein AAGK17_03240, partial [Pseudomonadota bacterium]